MTCYHGIVIIIVDVEAVVIFLVFVSIAIIFKLLSYRDNRYCYRHHRHKCCNRSSLSFKQKQFCPIVIIIVFRSH